MLSYSPLGEEPGIYCMRMRIIAAEFCGDRILSEYARIFMTSRTNASCSMERFVVCSPCYDEETGLGLYIDVLLRFESEIKVSATRIRDTPI